MADIQTLIEQNNAARQDLHQKTAAELIKAWQQVDPENIRASWEEQVPQASALVATAQLDAATLQTEFMGSALAEQGLAAEGPGVIPRSFSGISYPLHGGQTALTLAEYMQAPTMITLGAIKAGADVNRSLAAGLANLLLRGQRQVSDASRMAGSVSMSSRRRRYGFVRTLAPPSCSRCAILAGKWYRANADFDRHPGCDCSQVPASKAKAEELTTDPYEYFSSLSPAEQKRLFTEAGAKAINDGADIFQVVNARRGMYTSTGGSKVTYEGVTKRGFYGWSQTEFEKTPESKYKRAVKQRMMPEEIYKRAKGNKDREIALLQEYGYITGIGQNPNGVIRFG